MAQSHGLARVIAPGEVADGAQAQLRADEYGALHVRNELIAWCQEGAYFKALNPTPGTGIAMGIQTTFSDTANVLGLMRNGSTTKVVVPHYLRLICTAAGSTTTSGQLVIAVDNANRYTSGGTDLTPEIVNTNTAAGLSATVVDVLRFGVITAAAIVARRKIARVCLKTQAAPCWVVGDEVRIMFTSDDADQGLTSGAAAARYVANCGAVALTGQNHCLLVHQFNPANATTPPSWECEWAWWER